MRLVLFLSLILSGAAQAASLKAVTYKAAKCQLTLGEKVVNEVSQAMMVLSIDDGFGRFAQIQFGDEKLKIQYQLLIEDDLKAAGNIIVLQNFLVGKNEVSAEYSAPELSWVRIAGNGYSVKCEVSK